MRVFRLPEAPQREQRLLVRGELEQTGALPLGAGAFGFLWLQAPSEEDRREADVFAFYADDALVDSVRETLRFANLRLDVIEPYSVAAMRAYLVARGESGPVAMLCPSADHADLCIHDGGQVRYMRRIPGGWEPMRYARPALGETPPDTPDGQPRLGDSEDESEHGISPFGQPSREPASSSAAFLASEVARSFAFYSREYRDADVPRSLVVLAPQRYASDIAGVLEGVIPIPVTSDDPSVLLDLPEAAEGEQGSLGYLAAAGLGFGDVGVLFPRVDASRQEASAAVRRRAPNVLLTGMAASTVWMLLSVGASLALAFMQMSAEREKLDLKRAIDEEWAKREAPQRNQEIFSAARQAQLKAALPAATVLASVAQAYTSSLSLRTLKVEAGAKVSIEGDAASPESMQQFAANLAQTPGIKSPSFDMMHQDQNGHLTFRIVGSCSGLGPEGEPLSGGG
jgi:Tfp pilus assembly protein PilN